MTTPFDADLGTYQGRISKAGAPQGTYVYELGHALPGVVRSFVDGDAHETSQAGDLSGITLWRFTLDIRPPADVPLGMTWTFTASVSTASTSFTIEPGRSRRRVDLALNVFDFQGAGNVTATFSLSVSGAAGVTYEAEMPSVQVDAVLLDDTTSTPVFVRRDPEPGDVNVPVDTTIQLSTTDPNGGASAAAAVEIYVNNVLAMSNFGTPENGWLVSINEPDPYTRDYVLTPPTAFGSEEVVTVRVLAVSESPLPNEGSADQTWSFTCADLLAPALVSVIGFSRTEVLVQFDEDVLQQNPEGTNDALNPANYILTLSSGAPAIVPAVLSVESLTGDTVILHLDEEMTPGPTSNGSEQLLGATYLLTIPNVADVDGNVVADPGLQALFTGYVCRPPPGRRQDLVTLFRQMPAAVQSMDRAGSGELTSFLACLQEPANQILCDIDHWTDILDVDLAPEPFVDAMLADLGNPFEELSDGFSLVEKRKLVTLLVPILQQKGTNQGMVNAIRILLGVEVTITVPALDGVWDLGVSHLGDDTVLGTSDLASIYSLYVVSPVTLTDEQQRRIRKIVAYMRRAETHLAGIVEPDPPPLVPDDWELGLSLLGVGTLLH